MLHFYFIFQLDTTSYYVPVVIIMHTPSKTSVDSGQTACFFFNIHAARRESLRVVNDTRLKKGSVRVSETVNALIRIYRNGKFT